MNRYKNCQYGPRLLKPGVEFGSFQTHAVNATSSSLIIINMKTCLGVRIWTFFQILQNVKIVGMTRQYTFSFSIKRIWRYQRGTNSVKVLDNRHDQYSRSPTEHTPRGGMTNLIVFLNAYNTKDLKIYFFYHLLIRKIKSLFDTSII